MHAPAEIGPRTIHLPRGTRLVGHDVKESAMPDRIANHPLFIALVGAVLQPARGGPLAWLWGIVCAFASAIWADTFPGIFLLACVACLLDLRWGVLVAHHRKRYDPEKKRRGRDQKIITLTLLLMLRLAEAWAVAHGLLPVEKVLGWMGLEYLATAHVANDGGVISALVAAAVFWDELQSWDQHRIRLGAHPIPLLSAILAAGRVAQARIATALGAATPAQQGGP